jgi:serpin B
MGTAPLVAPADDMGALAGTEINDFGIDLLRQLDSSGNLCASPTSIALALAMVRAGARGQTATEMDKVLHDFGTTGQASEIVALIQALQAVTTYDDSDFESDDPDATPDETGKTPVQELDVSNAVFSQKDMTLEQAFLDSLSSSFGAGVGLVDYIKDPEAARQIINQWASERTKGRIPEILKAGDVDTDTRIALANAIYLKAAWADPFDPDATKSLPFTRADGSKVSVPTMAMGALFGYAAGKGYRAIDLPMGGDGSSLSMTIVVPDDMTSFVKGLTAAQLAGIESGLSTYNVDLTLPRFSANTRFDLSDILAAMGMPTAFNKNLADFSGITTDEPLYIQHVIHQANIDVVEEGTTASAVTVVEGGKGSCGDCAKPTPPPHVVLHINKPFLYFIQEDYSGAVLFMGRIDDPSASS